MNKNVIVAVFVGFLLGVAIIFDYSIYQKNRFEPIVDNKSAEIS